MSKHKGAPPRRMTNKPKFSDDVLRRIGAGKSVSLADVGRRVSEPPRPSAADLAANPKLLRGKTLFAIPAEVDPKTRVALNQAQGAFFNATNRRERLEAARWVIEELMAGNRMKSPFLEMPAPSLILVEINDLLAGRSSRLFQKIDLPPGEKPPRNSGRSWLAVASILFCAHFVKRLEGVGLEKALHKAVDDLEADLGGPLDDYLPTGERDDDAIDSEISERDGRHKRWVKRLLKDDPKLRAQNTFVGQLYRNDSDSIASRPIETIRKFDQYLTTRVTAANLLRAARDDAEDLLRQKGGKLLELDE